MTAGNYNTDILARRMYAELYSAGNYANASALAVILLLAVVPVLIFNLRQFRAVGQAMSVATAAPPATPPARSKAARTRWSQRLSANVSSAGLNVAVLA